MANGQLLGLLIVFAAFNMISYLAYYMAINRLQPAKATGLNVSYEYGLFCLQRDWELV